VRMRGAMTVPGTRAASQARADAAMQHGPLQP
jgi:hypothetical protein